MAKASKKRGEKKAAKVAKKKSKAKKSVKKAPGKRKGAKRAPAKRKPARRAPAKKRAPQPEPWPVIFAVLLAVFAALAAAYFNNPAEAAAVRDFGDMGAEALGLAVQTVKSCGFDAVTAALPPAHALPN